MGREYRRATDEAGRADHYRQIGSIFLTESSLVLTAVGLGVEFEDRKAGEGARTEELSPRWHSLQAVPNLLLLPMTN